MNSRIEVRAEDQWVFGFIDGKEVIAANARSGVASSRTVPANLDDAEAYAALIQAVVGKTRELREEGGAA